MKKNIIAVLLVITLASFAAFAVDPASFDVTTNVSGINKMKITTSTFSGTPAQFDSAAAFTGLSVTAYGAQTMSAYLSTMSNSRSGYKVSMAASAMKSSITDQADAYINYTVSVNSQSVTTNGAASVTPVDVVTVTSLSGLSSESHPISLTVDQTSFEAAVEGSYTGTVTFTYTAT